LSSLTRCKQKPTLSETLRSQSEVSNLLRIMMPWTQKYTGMRSPILQYPNLVLPHLTRLSFISSMREFLRKINGSLVLDEIFASPLQREHDEYLMEIVMESRLLTPKEIALFTFSRHTRSQISQKPMENTWMKPICADNHNTHL
jgi:hypothetical protein